VEASNPPPSASRYGHWFVVGHPLPSVNGQQTQTQAAPASPADHDAVLMPPLTVPGSPEPVSPAVPCQSPSSKEPLAGLATSDTELSATQTTWLAAEDAVAPATDTLHQPA
jgi:hypothetical protein